MSRWIYSIVTMVMMPGFLAFAATPKQPKSFSSKTIKALKSSAKIKAPKFDIQATLKKALDEQRPGVAPKFAESLKVKHSLTASGQWDQLDEQTDLWRLQVRSPKAKSLSFAFQNVRLPESAELYIYNADRSQVRGPLNANNPDGQLWTPIVFGEAATIELSVAKKDRSKTQLVLSRVNHDFRGFGGEMIQPEVAGSCNVDVACPERSGWEQQIQSVAVISLGGSRFCTGFLVNNTANDQKPLFMTAHHCRIDAGNASSLVAYWNYQNSDCREPNSTQSGSRGDGQLEQFTSGATYRAGSSRSDYVIVEFNQAIDSAYEVFYAGWNATTADATSAVAIHHPNTDEKRISFEFEPTSTTSYGGTEAPGDGTHVRVTDWDIGTTEPGSSGSPLFDQDGRVIGQLHGGGAACGNDDSDWYGRLSKSWELGLKDVLDPVGSGLMVVDGIGFEIDYLATASSIELTGLQPNGSVNPGARVVAHVTLENRGSKDITDLKVQLRANSDQVRIYGQDRNELSIKAGESVELHFPVHVLDEITCGAQLQLALQADYHSKVTKVAHTLQVGTELRSDFVMAGEPVVVPDNDPSGVTSSIQVSDQGMVASGGISVDVDIEHTYIGDLFVSLQSESGTKVFLHSQGGGSTENLRVSYPDQATPSDSLDAFAGQPLAGEWKLGVVDLAAEDVGQIKSWGLRFVTGYSCSK